MKKIGRIVLKMCELSTRPRTEVVEFHCFPPANFIFMTIAIHTAICTILCYLVAVAFPVILVGIEIAVALGCVGRAPL
jgi:hypothetical protein